MSFIECHDFNRLCLFFLIMFIKDLAIIEHMIKHPLEADGASDSAVSY